MKIVGVQAISALDGDGGTDLALSEIPDGWAENDFFIDLRGQDSQGNGVFDTPAGYTLIERDNDANCSAAAFYKKLTSSETPPGSGTTSTTEETIHYGIVVRGLDDSVKLIEDSEIVDADNTTEQVAPALTTTVDNCWILHYCMADGDTWPIPSPEYMMFEPPVGADGVSYPTVLWTFQPTAGACARPKFWLSKSAGDAQIISIAFRTDGNPPPHVDPAFPPTKIIHPLGFADTSGDYHTGTFNPSADLAGGIDGVDFNYDLGDTEVAGGHPGPLSYHGTTQVEVPSASSVNELWGFGMGCAEVDISDCEAVVFHALPAVAGEEATLDSSAVGGLAFGLRSDSGGSVGYRFMPFSGVDAQPPPVIQQGYVGDFSSSALDLAEINTFDTTKVDGVVPLLRKNSTVRGRFLISNVRGTKTIVMRGGYSDEPMKLQDVKDALMASAVQTISNQSGGSKAQFSSKQSVQIGNGVDDVYFADPNSSWEFAQASSGRVQNNLVTISVSEWTTYLANTARKTADYRNIVFNGPSNWPFTLHASTEATGTYHVGTVIGASVTLQAVTLTTAGTYIDCGDIAHNGADFSSGANFSNSRITISGATQSALQTALNRLAKCTFSNSLTVGLTIEYTGAAADISLNAPNGLAVDKTQYTSTNASQLSLSADVAANFPSTAFGGAATGLLIVAPTSELVISTDTAATLLRYFEDDSQTVADSVTGTTLSYEFPDADPVDIEAVKQGYVPINRADIVPYDGAFDIEMDFDESYNASHGLTITTEYDYNRATKALTINSDQSALDVRSALADLIRTNSSYYNTKLLMVAIPGLTRIDLTEGMTITSMATWKGAGMERFDAADSSNPVEKWFAVKSVGAITGATVHCRQQDSGDSTAITLTNNVVDEAFQYYRDDNHDGDTSDSNEYDYSGHMVIKSFLAGSKQGRVDVLANAGVSALTSNLFTVPLANISHDYSGTDPGITADLTLIAGGTEGGKDFSYEIVDGGTNTGANIADQLNYNAANNPNSVIPGGTGLRYFELPDMCIHTADAVETERGFEEGSSPSLVGFYVSRGGSDHPDFTRFQADDGTYYVPALQISITAANLIDDTCVQFYNVTKSAELTAKIVSGGSGASHSVLFGSGQPVEDGDQIRMIACYQLGNSAKLPIVSTLVASSSGVQFIETQEDDEDHNSLGMDGETVDIDASPSTGEIQADFGSVQIDANDPDGDFDCRKGIAWFRYITRTIAGIRVYDPTMLTYKPDVRNIEIDGALEIENISPSPLTITGGLWKRKDGGSIIAASSNTVIWVPNDRVYQGPETGVSGLTTPESANNALISTINTKIDTMDTVVDAIAASIAAGVDLGSINGDTEAALRLALSAKQITPFTIVAGTISNSVTTTNLTEATNDHYNGRYVMFTSGVLEGQFRQVQTYVGTGGQFTWTAITTDVPSAGDTGVLI